MHLLPPHPQPTTTLAGIVGDSPLREGFVSGFLLILFSEIGDKTFFIALLLALRQPKGIVFAGTFGALAVMTVISVLLGQVGSSAHMLTC
jgi:putative Ca2+/H+ antiporter (TMEM165/GDT1 family)